MSIIYIYGDESGTMPIKDNDPPFVVCTISTTIDIPEFRETHRHINWIIERINEFTASPHWIYVQPKNGYEKALQKRYYQMHLMSRITRLMTGANKSYISSRGINLRNYIWIRSMILAIGQTIISKVIKTKVTDLYIILDDKSLSNEDIILFKKIVSEIITTTYDILSLIECLSPDIIKVWKENVEISEENIHINWRSNLKNAKHNGGLILADYLSHYFLRMLIHNRLSQLIEMLKFEGVSFSIQDITDDIIKPIDPRTTKKWEKETGLKEPEL